MTLAMQNRPISPIVRRIRDDAIIVVHWRLVAAHGAVRAMSFSARSDPQRSCRASKKSTVTPMHAGSGAVTNLVSEIGLLIRFNKDILFVLLFGIYSRIHDPSVGC